MRSRGTIAALVGLLLLTIVAPDVFASSKAVRRATAGLPCKAEFTQGETTKSLRTLSVNPWTPDISTGELDILGDLMVGHIYGEPGGITTVDISDPLSPRWIGTGRIPGRFSYDAKITDDGTTAIVGIDDGAFAHAGIALFDIRDPAKPKLMGEWMSDRPGALQNGHMLYTQNIDGVDWVFLAPNDSTGVWILKIVGPPGKREIEYVTNTLLVEGGPLGPHDMYIGYDRDLETWVLYAADGYEGWLAYDIGDPATPQFIGGFLHPSTGYTHTIQAGKVAGRRIVATVEEVGGNFLKVYDATDMLRPVLLGVWSSSAVPVASQHNIQIVKDHLYIAHYRSGIFIFDLKPIAKAVEPLTSEIRPVAQYTPNSASFWDVVLKDGLVYGGRFGAGGGFDVFAFGCIPAGNGAYTSTG